MATEGTEERERIFATKSAKEREENVPVDALKSFGPDFLKEEHKRHSAAWRQIKLAVGSWQLAKREKIKEIRKKQKRMARKKSTGKHRKKVFVYRVLKC